MSLRPSSPQILAVSLAATFVSFTVSAQTVETEELVEIPVAEVIPQIEEEPTDTVSPATVKDPIVVNPSEADRNDDGKLTEHEIALQDHREQLKLCDLNNDKKISRDEWKAANKEARERNEKFHLVDKDEDGHIDETEAVRFLLERISVTDTYIDATEDGSTEPLDDGIEENAPSEVRVTLFSIPLGD